MPNRDAALLLHKQDEGVLRTGQAQHYQLETRIDEGGAECWDLTTRLPLWDANKAVVGIIVISRNVTDQKRAEARAEEAVRRRDQFLAMLSHELRNPLGAIVNATDLLQKRGLDAKSTQRSLEVMTRQSQQMARLLDDLLEVSRVTQNKIELRTEYLAIDAVARETANAFRQKFKAAGLDFAITIDAEDLHVRADPTRLQQIFANLLGNAAKYTPSGGRVTLSVAKRDGDAVIAVRDTGAGIPRQMLESVFDLFVQAGQTLDRAAGGIGVGLTLVRSLVVMHGGTITAYSAGEGKGSEFVVRLPLASAEAEKETPVQDATSRVRVKLPAGAKIVIVEDNVDGREMLSEILVGAGYECHTADDGAAGLALIDAVDPSVAILDIGLPTMDGYEVARRIRQDPKHADIWLIALTGYGQAADRSATRAAGFDEHVVKPVQVDQILRRLSSMQTPESASQDRALASF
jgi:two-component system CheB/CheR fusion protein